VVLVAGLSTFAVGSTAQEFAALFVAPWGSDTNPGTEAAPFQTLERARDSVRALAAGMTGDIVVYLRGGSYALANTVVFEAQDSGTNGFQVVYAATPANGRC
jgi:hypothetical protein